MSLEKKRIEEYTVSSHVLMAERKAICFKFLIIKSDAYQLSVSGDREDINISPGENVYNIEHTNCYYFMEAHFTLARRDQSHFVFKLLI
jgi:hypothetical protein